jgi:hypothetical protein
MPGYPHFLILMGTQIQTFSGNPVTAKGPAGKNNVNGLVISVNQAFHIDGKTGIFDSKKKFNIVR